jgi:DNA-binding transcriptional LysR family regulator
VTHAGNPLLKKKKLKAEDVIEDRFMVADREIGYCALLEQELNRRGVELKPAMDIGSVEAIVNIMRDGYGTSFIPEYMAKEYLDKRLDELGNKYGWTNYKSE